ncbi:2-octaprenyl-6-methoxyphenyl hydroxylase [Hwanghaeella grinnelliae]|uniref:2-octaprenyl-6-methoxyphenyl hydroxylase n=1 Tax=Hwanghaeella grinnelliae TaxID=2500179 RepID=A0A3S2Y2H0_9PROT|nr:UbiH/UbiF/VisC/COQ6 family ubiquinone biosynthesis hydroxylase [Hwanghaeella grinnelliae]RVU36162.1 2-octaprenyl-6-methoxyphenyl hydroxylase [Hwanghaeella grinnelliae]
MTERVDVGIVGGGMVGAGLACALATAGLRVALVDREAQDMQTVPAYDGRASAIAYGSAQVLKGIGVWKHLEADASPIWDIRVVDGHVLDGISPLFLHYDHTDIGDDPFGYIVENRATRVALHKRCTELETLTLHAPVNVTSVQAGPGFSTIEIEDGEPIQAAVVIAADGKFSTLRDWMGIKVTGWRYDQTSIVCTVKHALPHNGVAVELFLPSGPFAMLPMTGDRSNIVWSERSDLARGFAELDDAAFLAELKTRFGDWLGDIELVGPRFTYPLSLQHAETYIGDRFAMVGDAAHAVHPIAGQGLNMGLRDIAAMAEVLVDAKRLGLDLGAASVLRRYEKWRRFDNVLLSAVMDGLTRLFSNDVAPVRLARDIGLAAVNKTPPVKRFLMRHAMGVVGELPRLIRGEAL